MGWEERLMLLLTSDGLGGIRLVGLGTGDGTLNGIGNLGLALGLRLLRHLALLGGACSLLGSGLLLGRGRGVLVTLGLAGGLKLDQLLLGLGVHGTGAGGRDACLLAQQIEVDLSKC